jgi:hypothetical protein
MINAMRKVKVKTDDGRILTVRGTQYRRISLLRESKTGTPLLRFRAGSTDHLFEGDAALRLAGTLLPAINASGGNKTAVAYAVKAIEAADGPEAFLAGALPLALLGLRPDKQAVAKLATPNRLAIEMALHEEPERRAIEGELEMLEEQWREAEEIAGIADNLLLPPAVEQRLDELKQTERDRRADGEAGEP